MDSNNKKILGEDNENKEQFHSEKYKKKSDCPNFLLKLYQILEKDEYKDIIEWGEDGTYFIVKNLHDFTENILPKYYKHNNYSSFIRQLNMYDFHKRKSSPNEHIFEHKNFIRNKKELLKLIKRKTKRDNNINDNINQIYTQYIPYISNKFLPGKDTDLVPINQNINDNENNFFPNINNKKSFLSLDDKLSLNNNSMKLFPYKKMPLLPMGNSANIENGFNNNNNINNLNNNNFHYNINNYINNYFPNKEDKKITKKYLQNHLSYLMDSIEKNTEMQNQLEIKIERLSKQNEEFINQNQEMLQEIMSKNDYNKKLEAVICFILEMIVSKSKMKNNPELNKLLLSNETICHNNNLNNLGLINFNSPNNGILSPNGVLSSNDFNSGGNLEPFKTFINKYWEKSKNNGFLTNKDNNQYNKLLDEDKYFCTSYNNNYNTNLNAKILKKNLIGEKDNNFQISPFLFNNKRKRSSSFNSILSNLSKGSNVIYNNNKLLKNDEEENKGPKIEDKKTDKNDEKLDNNTNDNNIDNNINDNMNFDLSRKDSISNESKNAFDLDLNQEENKSYLSGWSKDLLNNSQSSFNEVYNNVNKDNDSFSNLNN